MDRTGVVVAKIDAAGTFSPNKRTRGHFSGNIAAGADAIISHGLGVIPTTIMVTQRTTSFSYLFFCQVADATNPATSTQFHVMGFRYDTAALASTPAVFDWVAEV